MPKITVIIPIYNSAKYLNKCLDSVLMQSLDDIEVICINDKSTDNSIDILKEYAKNDDRIKIINHEENKGPGVARNLGIKSAIGEYIMFLDPDDWFEPTACEDAYNLIKKNKNSFALFGFYRFYEEDQKRVEDTRRLKPFKSEKNKNKIKLFESNENFLTTGETWCQIYNREFLLKNNVEYANLYICEDNLFLVKAIVASENISYIDKPLYNYRIHNNSATTACNVKWKELLYAKELAYYEIFNSNKKNCYINKYLVWYINSTIYWFERFSKLNKKIEKDFYYELQNLFKRLLIENNIDEIKNNIDLNKFIKIAKYSYLKFKVNTLIKKLFKINNEYSNNTKYKQIIFLGIKIKIKVRDRNGK